MVDEILETVNGTVVHVSDYWPGIVSLTDGDETWEDVVKLIQEDMENPAMPDDLREDYKVFLRWHEDAKVVPLDELQFADYIMAMIEKNEA